MKTIKVRKDKKTGKHYLSLRQMLKGTKIKFKDVKYYTMDESKDGELTFTFLDKDKKQLKI